MKAPATLAVLLAAAHVAHAGGLEYPDNGAQALGRGGAFVARADDGSTWWHNPAGLAKLAGYQLYLSANLSFASQSFDREGNYPAARGAAYEGQPYPSVESSGFFPAPFAAFTAGIGDKLTVALGFGGPSAIGNKDYPEFVTVNGVQAPAPQRYDVVKNDTLIAFSALSAGYRVSPKIDIGASLMWGIGIFKNKSYAWGTRNPEENPGNDSGVDLSVHDYFIPSFNLGVLFRPSPKLEAGMLFRYGAKVEATGTVKAIFGDTLMNVGTKLVPIMPCEIDPATQPDQACAEIKAELPMMLRGGVRYIMRDPMGREKGDIELDLNYEFWDAFDAYSVHVDGMTPIRVEDQRVEHQYKNTFGVRLGGSYQLGKVAARAGVAFDTAASPDEFSRLDGDSWAKLTGGAGASYTTRGVTFDLSAVYVKDFAPTVAAGKGDIHALVPVISYPPDPPSNTINEGKFAASAFVLGVGLRFAFGELGGARSGTSQRNPYLLPAAALPGAFGEEPAKPETTMPEEPPPGDTPPEVPLPPDTPEVPPPDGDR